MKVNLQRKVGICRDLALPLASADDTQKQSLIAAESEKLNVSESYVKGVLSTFFETGGKFVDRRCKTGFGTIEMKPTVVSIYPRRNIKPKTAAKIIREYMTSNRLNSREISNKYRISVVQFYELIKELTNSGTLLGNKVIKVEKYSKNIPITDVIWYFKYPKTKRKSIEQLTQTEKLSAYTIAKVMERKLERLSK